MVPSCARSGVDYSDEDLRHGKNTRLQGLEYQEILENWTFSPLTSLGFCSQRGCPLLEQVLGFPHLPCNPFHQHTDLVKWVFLTLFSWGINEGSTKFSHWCVLPNTISEGFGIWTPESGLWTGEIRIPGITKRPPEKDPQYNQQGMVSLGTSIYPDDQHTGAQDTL